MIRMMKVKMAKALRYQAWMKKAREQYIIGSLSMKK